MINLTGIGGKAARAYKQRKYGQVMELANQTTRESEDEADKIFPVTGVSLVDQVMAVRGNADNNVSL